jgi:hypothetical protein
VFFEFHSSYFVIRDCQTGIPLHQGPIKDGLYQLHPSPSSSSSIKLALVGERTSNDHWHKCLGHPAYQAVNKVLSHFHLPVVPNKASNPCTACSQAKGHSVSTSSVCNPSDLIFFRCMRSFPNSFYLWKSLLCVLHICFQSFYMGLSHPI